VIGLLVVFREFFRAIRLAIRAPGTQALMLTTAVVLAGGSLFYMAVEGWSVIDSIYFSIITLATIGYGDLAPTKDISKVFTIFYVLVGIGLIASTVATIAGAAVQAGEDRRARIARRAGGAGDTAPEAAPGNPLVERFAARHTPSAVTESEDPREGGKEEVDSP
jgi:hypothetical protein